MMTVANRPETPPLVECSMKLLVSVRNEVEARQALRGECDILDIKEPAHGSLGAAPLGAIERILQAVAGAVPVSAALGELIDLEPLSKNPPQFPPSLEGLTYLKTGPARLLELPDWKKRFRDFADQTRGRTVAVIYADGDSVDAPPPEQIFEEARQARATGLLIDTCRKGTGHLLDWITVAQLHLWKRRTSEAGMFLALAGSLCLDLLPHLLPIEPDIIAVRGAVCRGLDRTAAIDENLVRLWHERLNPGRSQLPADLAVR